MAVYMDALVSREPGGADKLELGRQAIPQAGTNEILVKVAACSLNYPDNLIIRDLYQERIDRPFAPGGDIAGTVTEIGPGVSRFAAGDRVWGNTTSGGLAEYLSAQEDRFEKLPDSVSFEKAAAASLTYFTAYHALVHRGALYRGEKLLVLGAGGGVGSAAVDLGTKLGADVTAAASSIEKLRPAKNRGTKKFFVYSTTGTDLSAKDISANIRDLYPEGFDLVLDPVGGPLSEAALRNLRYGGRLLVTGFAAGIGKLPLNLPLLKSCQVVGVSLGAFRAAHPDHYAKMSRIIGEMLAAGELNPTISRNIRLDEAAAALDEMWNGNTIGKTVISFE